MRLAIIETGAPPEPLRRAHADYGAMMERMLSPLNAGFSFSRWRVFDGEPIPPLAEFDGMLITGSAAGVYEAHDWIAPLERLILAAAAARKPQVGICFGHQLLAQAFGGKVEKSAKGWGVGLHDYRMDGLAEWMTPGQSRIACAVSHQDQVVDLPRTARRLGGSDFCENGVVDYLHAPAISFQPHPEFTHDYAHDLLSMRRGRVPEGLADDGLASFRRKSDRTLIAGWITEFYRANS